MRTVRSAKAPPSASRPMRPTIGSSLAVLGRLLPEVRPEVPTGWFVSAVVGAVLGGVLGWADWSILGAGAGVA